MIDVLHGFFFFEGIRQTPQSTTCLLCVLGVSDYVVVVTSHAMTALCPSSSQWSPSGAFVCFIYHGVLVDRECIEKIHYTADGLSKR